MEYLIIFMIIFIISTILSLKLNKKIDEIIPISVLTIVIIVYISGLFNNLQLGVTIVKTITIIALIYAVYLIINIIKNKEIKQIEEKILTPGLVIYLIFIMLSIIFNKGRIIEYYDSFNHWALIVKNMFFFNAYGAVENSIISFNEYPPFTATFQYLFVNIKGAYSEDTIITAQNILYFSMIMPIFKKIRWKKEKRKLINVLPVVMILPIIFYSNFYTDILVDGFIGILFALCLYQIYSCNEDKKYKYLILCTYIISISLTKNIGILFGIITLVLETINILKEKQRKSLKGVFLIILILIISLGSWFIKIKISSANLNWDKTGEMYLQQEKETERNLTIHHFIHEIFEPEQKLTGLEISLFACIVIYITYSIFLYYKMKYIGKNSKLKCIFITIGITTFFYLLGMLTVYLTLFENDEVEILSSFDRYISTMLLAGFFFNGIITCENVEFKLKHISLIITVLVLFLPVKDLTDFYINANNHNKIVFAKRSDYGKITKYKNLFNEKDKIYFVTNRLSDYRYAIALSKYEMLPTVIGNNDGTVFKNLKNELNDGYTYIYILHKNNSFNLAYKLEFGEEIDFEEDTLYKINRINNKIEVEKVLIKDIWDIL